MELLEDLEPMAQAACASTLQENDENLESTISRWQKIFGYSASLAEFKEHAYNYRHTAHDVIDDRSITMKERRMLRALSFLIKLEGPFSNVKSLIKAASLSLDASTEVFPATGLFGQPCSFYRINGMDRLAIKGWLARHPQPDPFSPTYVRDVARKDLSSTSLYPTLGLDTTLPQHRPESDRIRRLTPRPSQNEYPVWYFCYGTLLDKAILAKLFGSDFHAPYRIAKIRGGTVKTMGRYNALVDDESGINVVHGKAMRVQTREHEERLRAYETNVYEAVRCKIDVGPNEFINGLTFRFIADFMD